MKNLGEFFKTIVVKKEALFQKRNFTYFQDIFEFSSVAKIMSSTTKTISDLPDHFIISVISHLSLPQRLNCSR